MESSQQLCAAAERCFDDMTDGSVHCCAAARGRPGGPVGPPHLWGFAAGPVSCQLLEPPSQMLVEEALLQRSETFS